MPSDGTEQRKLAAIMFTDMVGYSALAQRNEALALELLEEHRRVLRSIFPKHNGREIETAGDAFLVEFVSALEAVRCAVEIQEKLSERNRSTPGERAIRIRIGVHVGDVVHLEGKVMGDAVNIAARIEPLASPGGICVSEDVARQIHNKLDHPLVTLGPSELKNIELPVVICRVVLPWESAASMKSTAKTVGSSTKGNLRLVATSVVMILAAVSWWFFHQRSQSAGSRETTGRITSLAVKPLDDFSGDTNNAYLSDGMTEALCAALGNISELRVPGRSSIMRYKSGRQSIREMAKDLGVDAIVEGSVQRAGNRILITVRLVEAASDRHLWSTNYERDLGEFFKVQSEVARAIAGQVQVRLTPEDQVRLARGRSVHPQALEAYLQGRHEWNRRAPDALRKAIDLFQKSVEIDPDFALGHSGLADAYCLASDHLDLPFNEAYTKARVSALKAVELDDRLAEPHVALGFLLANADWKWREAESEFLHAIALKPNYPPAHYWYAFQLLVKEGRTNEALAHAETALKLDPVTPTTRLHYALVLIAAGRNGEAIDQARTIEKLEPDFPLVNWIVFLAHLRGGNYGPAIAAGEQLRARINRPWVWGHLGYAYAVAGRMAQAKMLLDDLARQPRAPLVAIAEIQTGLGMSAEALSTLESAHAQRFAEFGWLTFYPAFDRLRADPRFQQLLRDVGLEP